MAFLILASGSTARARLLTAAQVPFVVDVPRVDEAAIREALAFDALPPIDVAMTLAQVKAERISLRHPDALVLGADQILVCNQRIYEKPADRLAAAQQLRDLRGQTHELISAAVICQNGAEIWRQAGRAKLQMRDFSDAFLNSYLDQAGEAVLSSVGAYHIEGMGAQLFSQISGDSFTIQGLPLLPLLGFLRLRNVIMN